MSSNPDTRDCEIGHRFSEPKEVVLLQRLQTNDSKAAGGSMINVKKCVFTGGVMAAALIPCMALAALGEPETSVQADMAQLHASIKVTARADYRLHEMLLPSGTRVREFVGSDGKVFAVAWTGPTVPNLRQTFGRYFDSYVSAAKGRRPNHSLLQVHQSDLVVQSSGHMRAFMGRAYLPGAVPGGVDLGEIQ